MIRFAVSIVFVPFLVGAGGQAEAMSQPDRPLLIPPQLADRPQPDSRRGVAGVPRLPFDSDAAKGALTGTHASIPPPEDPSAYLFPGPIIGSVGGEWAVTADFNDDGWTDVAGARRNDCTVHVLHGAPDGTFDGPDEYSIEASCGIGGDYPKSLAVGHFDDDALEDLVVLLLNRVVLLFGQADGTFVVDDVSYPMGGTTVLTGDFDADGFSDVVTSGVALRRGQGDRTLGPLTSLEFTGDYPSAVFVADQNADGVDDLFGLVRVGSYWNHYWGWVSYGQEGMGLGEPTMLPVPRSAKLLTVGDFNGDGRGDVAIVGYYYHYEGCGDNCDWLTIFYGQSDGTLGDASTYDAWTEFHPIWLSESAGANFMGAGDLDGDGRDDLVVEYFWSRPYSSLNTSSALMVLYGPDGRKWKPWRTTWRPGGTYFGGFTFADLDQDKRAELLSFGGVILDYRTSQGRLATRSDIWPGLTRSRWSLRGVTTADLDGDGALDLAVADEEEWEVRILWGDGTGEFDIDPTTYPTFGRPVNLEAADLNGDDLPDLVVALTAAHNTIQVFYQTAPRTFDVSAGYDNTGGTGIAVADFNYDELADVAVGDTVLYGQADGTLGDRVTVGVSGDIVAADFDWDGWMDLAGVCGVNKNGLGVAYNLAGAGFTEPQCVQVSQSYTVRATTAGDFNGDGWLDLAAWETYTGCVIVLYGQYGGVFEDPVRYCHSSRYVGDYLGLIAADFNRDGYDDLCAGTYLSILLGSEEGLLPDVQRYWMDGSALDYAVGDFNNNGRLDVAAQSTTVLGIMLNQDTHKAVGELAVESVTAPASGLAGQIVDVSWTVCNTNDKPLTAKWTDGVYISRDETWDIYDRCVGTLEFVGTLEAAGDPDGKDCYTRDVQVSLPPVLPGDYYLLARTDIYEDVQEENEDDNIGVAPITLEVHALDVCHPDDSPEECPGFDDGFAFTGQPKLYKIAVIEGEDLLVALDATSEEGVNELYIRYEYPATRVTYDGKYETPFAPDQTVRIPGTHSGVYYILVYADQLPEGVHADFNLWAEYLPFDLTGIGQDNGGNVGRLTAQLSGSLFSPDTIARLLDDSGETYEAVAVYFEAMSTIWATFDLAGLPPGSYGVQVVDGATRTVPNALTVTEGGGPEFETLLVVPDVLRVRGRNPPEFAVLIRFTNLGNVDATDPLVFVEGDNEIWHREDPSVRERDLVIPEISTFGPSTIVSPGEVGSLELRTQAPTALRLRSHATTRLNQGPNDFATAGVDFNADYFKDLLTEILGAATQSQLLGALGTVTRMTNSNLGCNVLSFMLAHVAKKRSELANIVGEPLYAEKEAAIHNIHAAITAAWDAAGCGTVRRYTGWISSWDPNDKLSPNGVGESGFVLDDKCITYIVRFENLPTATAAALQVDVTDQLADNLDWTTVTLDEIGFAGTVIEVPEGLSHYEGRVEVDGWTWNETDGWHQYDEQEEPVVPLVVDIEAGIDIDTGVVNWTITCADRNTGTWPEDPYAGFLPPNQEEIFYPDPEDPNDPPRMIHPGEGYLSYSVQPVPDLPTGTEITNMASIVFDWNNPIDTPEVLNTIDAEPPTSAVDPLPAEMPYAHFEVCWSGEDDPGGSGIGTYTAYVSDDGGPYTAWVTTEDECGWYTHARVGHTYDFYSIARDHVGHIEPPPTDPDDGSIIPDTTTTISGLVGDFDGDDDVDLDDYFFLEICLSICGPGGDPGFQECVDIFDLDDIPDGDVDLEDFAAWQRLFTGQY